MKNKLIPALAFLIMSSASQISAQDTAKNGVINEDLKVKQIDVIISDEAAMIIGGKKITLAEAITKAIELNPDIYMTKYNAAMSDTNLMKYNSQYSPYLRAEGGISSVTNPEFLYSKNGEKTDSIETSVSVAKSFSTGTTIVAGTGYTSSRLNTGSYRGKETGALVSAMELDVSNPVIFATIEQELLKNAFGKNNRKQEKILENASLAERDAHLYSISMIALGVIVDYWSVVIAQNHLENSKMMLSETKKVRSIVAEKVNIGLSEKFEMNYWNSMVASSKAAVAQAEQEYRNVIRKFLRNINSDIPITMEERVVLSAKLPEINPEEAIKKAFEKRVDYQNALRAVENSRLSLQINENSSLPSLKGTVSISSMDYSTESAGETYSNASALKYPSYNAKLSLTYPLDDTGQKADERNAKWMVEQSKQNLEKTKRYVKDDITTKIENINTGYRLYSEAKEARKQAELYYSSMLTNMRRGRFAASSVRDALDGVTKTREMELKLLVVYNASLIEFELAKNELFETYNIDVNKYIPKE